MGMAFNLKEGDSVFWHDDDGEHVGEIVQIKYAFDALPIVDDMTPIVVKEKGGQTTEHWPHDLAVLTIIKQAEDM